MKICCPFSSIFSFKVFDELIKFLVGFYMHFLMKKNDYW